LAPAADAAILDTTAITAAAAVSFVLDLYRRAKTGSDAPAADGSEEANPR